MKKTNPDHPAFSRATDNPNLTGLTKREYFASQALQGLLGNPNISNADLAAGDAVAAADFLVRALNCRIDEHKAKPVLPGLEIYSRQTITGVTQKE